MFLTEHSFDSNRRICEALGQSTPLVAVKKPFIADNFLSPIINQDHRKKETMSNVGNLAALQSRHTNQQTHLSLDFLPRDGESQSSDFSIDSLNR